MQSEYRPIKYEAKDIDACLDTIDRAKMVSEFNCYFCGAPNKIPLIARREDIIEFNSLKNVIFTFLDKHPEIEQSLLKELMDDLLGYLHGKKE